MLNNENDNSSVIRFGLSWKLIYHIRTLGHYCQQDSVYQVPNIMVEDTDKLKKKIAHCTSVSPREIKFKVEFFVKGCPKLLYVTRVLFSSIKDLCKCLMLKVSDG